MGWGGKDAVGEILNVGDKVVYFRDKSGYNRGEGYDIGSVGVVYLLEDSDYEGQGSVKVELDYDRKPWMCHKDLMKI